MSIALPRVRHRADVYTLDQFGLMIGDELRMKAYSAAIERCVRPGDAVLDLGCGPGVFALLACKAGARRVYAIDTNGVVDFGKQLAAANGLSEKILFLRGDSRQVHLPERVDVIVADLRGVVPLYAGALETLCDARERFLAPGGKLIPAQDTLYAAVVELPETYQELSGTWNAAPGLNLEAGLPLVLNTLYRRHLKPRQLLSEPRAWHVIDYLSAERVAAQGQVQLPITRDAKGHGIGLWFAAELAEGVGFATTPQESESVYGHLFLPWLEPLPLQQGEICTVDLRASLVGPDYIWHWETNVRASTQHPEKRFVQSTFYGSLFPPSTLRRRAAGYVPVLSEAGQAERWMLQAIDGKKNLQEIAEEATRMYPHIFRRVEDAFFLAAEIADKFSN